MFGRKKNTLEIAYSIRRSQRAKKMRIVVTPEKVEVVAPVKQSERSIRQFVQSQQAWINHAQLKVSRQQKTMSSLAPSRYAHGVKVPYQGRKISLAVKPANHKNIKIVLDQELLVYVPNSLSESMHSDQIRTALTQWCQQQALSQVKLQVEKHAPTRQLFPRSVKVKTQKSRWGSCGVKNDIYLNWLLILAPPEVLEYVVVHEICHIQERNHSVAFWRLVGEHMPDYQQHRQWLKRHGRNLMLGL